MPSKSHGIDEWQTKAVVRMTKQCVSKCVTNYKWSSEWATKWQIKTHSFNQYFIKYNFQQCVIYTDSGREKRATNVSADMFYYIINFLQLFVSCFFIFSLWALLCRGLLLMLTMKYFIHLINVVALWLALSNDGCVYDICFLFFFGGGPIYLDTRLNEKRTNHCPSICERKFTEI